MDLKGTGYGLDRSGLGQHPVWGTCELGTEPSGSMAHAERVPVYPLFKYDSAPRSQFLRADYINFGIPPQCSGAGIAQSV
jgi:hypothetical protein